MHASLTNYPTDRKKRARVRYCKKRAHDTLEVGRDANGRCLGCRKLSQEAHYARNRATTISKSMRGRYSREYGLSEAEVIAMRARGCDLCGSHEKVCVDHDHGTGQVRGALCHKHNCALGLFNDDTDMLALAIAYLKGE